MHRLSNEIDACLSRSARHEHIVASLSNVVSGQARHHNRFITGKIKPQIPRTGVQGM